MGSRLNFPSDHPLNLTMDPEGCYRDVDVVLTLDIADFEKPTHVRDIATRTVVSKVPANATWIDIGFTDIEISKWATDYNKHHNWDLRVLGDSALSLPALTAACKKRIEGNKAFTAKIAERKKVIGDRHARQWQKWQDQVKEEWDQRPMTESRLAHELRLKRTPQLTFEYDPTVERGVRMTKLIDELAPDDDRD